MNLAIRASGLMPPRSLSQESSETFKSVKDLSIFFPGQMMFPKRNPDMAKKRSNMKTSLVARLKQNAFQYIPRLEEIADEVFPKKVPVVVHNLGSHNSLYSVNKVPVLIERADGVIFPYLKLAMEWPKLLRSVYCYEGAVKAILSGAKLMARGPFGTDETFEKGEVVQLVMVGAKEPFAIGVMEMSGTEIEGRPDGPSVSIFHALGDGLWNSEPLY